MRRTAFAVGPVTILVTSTAVLVGHEDWVHCVCFRPRSSNKASCTGPPDLLTCSMDRTLVLWRPEANTGLWMAETSFGDAGALIFSAHILQ